MVKIIHYLVLGVLALGAIYYVWTKPPTINPMLDRRGADALAMVQTHRALGYPTLLQAMTEHVRSMKERGLNARLDSRALWRVVKLGAEQRALLKRAADRWQLSARASLRVLKVARTIADLEQSAAVTTGHVAEALQLRCRSSAQ